MAKFRKIEGGGGGDYYDSDYEESRPGYQEKIHKYRLTNFYRTLLVIVAIILVAILVWAQYRNHVYTGYEVVSSVDRTVSASSVDETLGKSIVTYSHDGAQCSDAKGNMLWNQTYQIQDLLVAKDGSTVCFASYNGRDIYVLNDSTRLSHVETTLPIRNVAVSDSGWMTAILFDTDVTRINTYNEEGVQIFEGKSYMSGSGYPAGVALSPSGSLLQVSYVYVETGSLKTTVAFYNFSSVGDNYRENMVSAFEYSDMLVPEVGFLNDTTAYAVGDGRLMIYKGEEQPGIVAEYMYDDEVRSVFAGGGHVALVFNSDTSDAKYRIEVYNSSGARDGVYYFNMDYSDVIFEKEDFVIYNESSCKIITYDGREKYEGNFGKNIRLMIPTENAYRYLLVSEDTLDVIQLN